MDCEDVGHRFLDIVEDPPAQFDRLDDRREVVLQQDQGRRLAGDVRSAPSHGDPDVCRFQGRSIVHPVTGHGYDLAVGLQGIDDPELLLGDDTGEDVDISDLPGQLLIRRRIQFRARDRPPPGLKADLPGDALSGDWVVAGDHHHAHAGVVAFSDRVRDPWPNRIRQPDKPEIGEIDIMLLVR
jgi:hypothetical protein